jgi:hypothetical protein
VEKVKSGMKLRTRFRDGTTTSRVEPEDKTQRRKDSKEKKDSRAAPDL